MTQKSSISAEVLRAPQKELGCLACSVRGDVKREAFTVEAPFQIEEWVA